MSEKPLVQVIQSQLAFQNRWRGVMSVSYFTITSAAIVFSAAATVVTAQGHAVPGSVLAGTATALLGLEKALLLRQKWAHHLQSAGRLEAILIEYNAGILSDAAAAAGVAEVIRTYAGTLPLVPAEAPAAPGGTNPPPSPGTP